MKNNRSTKRALLMSVLALVMCMSMLVGTTFAWFTDSVTSGNNKIVAGNLDVELEYYKNGKWATVNNATDLFSDNLWEPGHAEVVYLRLSNLGSLALNYQMGINIASETESISVATNEAFKLSDYIQYSVVGNVNGETVNWDREEAIREASLVVDGNKKLNESFFTHGFMLANQAPIYMAVVVYMPTSVGNEANHLKDAPTPTIELGINLMATQKDNENDSFGDDYDLNASNVVTDIKEYYELLSNEQFSSSFYEDNLLPLYKLYSIESLLTEIKSRKVWLKSGAYLVIDYTEALTVIDVNTGKFDKGKNKAQTLLKINLEAAIEAMRQIRLRNISGIIIIDFIDMTDNNHKEQLLNQLKEEATKDPIKTSIMGMTRLNLLEMTRMKIREQVIIK